MTTKQDWLFRADYMRMMARQREEKAKTLQHEAFEFKCRAESCMKAAEDMDTPEPHFNG